VSPLYETAPVGGPSGQPWYLNLVVGVRTHSSPRQLLELAHELEGRAGRVRTVRFGPRTLDVDVLLVGDLSVDEDDLVVPHPRMWERAFVLAPLEDLDPSLVPAGWRERLGAAAGEDSVRRVGSLDLT
jgi:2-amino-4-hydroxy-6-hydroxymethyldihydropteridine diphosphokinase